MLYCFIVFLKSFISCYVLLFIFGCIVVRIIFVLLITLLCVERYFCISLLFFNKFLKVKSFYKKKH